MPPRSIPIGSVWRVMRWLATATRDSYLYYGKEIPPDAGSIVRAWSMPIHKNWLMSSGGFAGFANEVFFPEGSLLFIGETVPSLDGEHVDFVQVLIPQHAYINRLHFNEGSPYLTRIA